MGFCNDNWYTPVWYEGELFSVSQPAKAQCDDESGGTISNAVLEFGITMQLQFFLGAFFLAYVLWRSCSRLTIDPYRLFFLYLIGTVPFMITVMIGPSKGGFHRLIGYAVLVHNLAEWFIINRIWVGDRHVKRMYSILYVVVFLIAIAIVPLWPLYYIAMLQGGFCDYNLLFSFIALYKWMNKQDNPKLAKHMKIACAAAIVHIISIQPLFFGLSTAYPTLLYMTTLFLIPTFVLYVWFALSVAGYRGMNIFDPSFGYNIKSLQAQQRTNELLRSLLEKYEGKQIKSQLVVDENGYATAEKYNQANVQMVVVNDEKDEENGYELVGVAKNCYEIGIEYKKKLEECGMDCSDFDVTPQGKDIYYLLIYGGLIDIDPSMVEVQKKVYIGAFLVAFINSTIILFSPCYMDFSDAICGR